jgi:hypothetical protein
MKRVATWTTCAALLLGVPLGASAQAPRPAKAAADTVSAADHILAPARRRAGGDDLPQRFA